MKAITKHEDMNMGYIEISQAKIQIPQAAYPNGRRPIKIVLHEIYPDNTFWNENGITYLEKYTRDNAESVKGMPLCAQFLDDDMRVPYGHGMTGRINNMPTFEDSVQVGAFDDWSIEDIEVDGRVKRCMCATGYLNEARYPKFVKWVIDRINDGQTVHGSVEFVGTLENEGEIIYDGGWKREGRIPMIYDYSGYCILSIRPSDEAAILVELNQKDDSKNRKEENNMAMTQEELQSIVSGVKAGVVEEIRADNKSVAEINAKIEEKDSKIAELNQEIEKLNEQLAAKDTEIAELNADCATAKKRVSEVESEMNAKMEEMNATNAKVVDELNELKKANKVAELNSALSKYTDEQKDYAKDEIEAFNADPFSVEVNSIVTKIDATSYRKMREKQEAQHKAEINSKNEFDDIMANIDPIVNDDKEVETFDVFA